MKFSSVIYNPQTFWYIKVHMISSPELLNKYVGESEHNLRALFYQAEKDTEELGSNRYVVELQSYYVTYFCQQGFSCAPMTLKLTLIMWKGNSKLSYQRPWLFQNQTSSLRCDDVLKCTNV